MKLKRSFLIVALLAPLVAGCGASDAEVQAAASSAAKNATDKLLAEQGAAAEKAAAEKAAAEKAAAEKEAAERRTVNGSLLVVEFDGVLDPLVKDTPNDTIGNLTKRKDILDKLIDGKTFPCPEGPGGGFSDLREGAQVTVEDGDGKLLATTSLTGGVLSGTGCTFTYSAPVPKSDFYKIKVGNREPLAFSYDKLEADDWKVSSKI